MSRGLGLLAIAALGAVAVSAVSAACGAFGADDGSSAQGDAASDAPGSDSSSMGSEAGPSDGGACALQQTPTVVAPTSGAVTKIASNGVEVFWTEGDARLMRANLDTCKVNVVASGTIDTFAVNASYVVWSEPTYRALPRNDLSGMPLKGLTQLNPSLVLPDKAFWLGPTNITECATPCLGGTTNAVTIAGPKLLAANASSIFFFAVDPDGGAQRLFKHPQVGGGFTAIASPTADAVLLAANSTHVFWVDAVGMVFAVDVAGAGVKPLLPLTTLSSTQAIAADEAYLYVATSDAVLRIPNAATAGVLPTTMAAGQSQPLAVTVTANQLLWANAGEQTIRRMMK